VTAGMRTRLLVLVFLGLAASSTDGSSATVDNNEIESFNRKFAELILKTDHPGMLAMWAEDGVDLMPGEAPIIGKVSITAWIKDIESKVSDSRVTKETIYFHDIQYRETGRQSGLQNIRLCSHWGSLRLKAMARWRWCCIAIRADNGKSNKRCGMTHLSLMKVLPPQNVSVW
jgi:hypothetical protein